MIAKKENLIKQILIIVFVFLISTVLTSLIISKIYHSKSTNIQLIQKPTLIPFDRSNKLTDTYVKSTDSYVKPVYDYGKDSAQNRFLKSNGQQSSSIVEQGYSGKTNQVEYGSQIEQMQQKQQQVVQKQVVNRQKQELTNEQLKNMKLAVIKDDAFKKNPLQIEYEEVQWDKTKSTKQDQLNKQDQNKKDDKNKNNFAITIKQDQNLKQYEIFKNSNIKFVSANIKKIDNKDDNKLEVVFNGAVNIKNKK